MDRNDGHKAFMIVIAVLGFLTILLFLSSCATPCQNPKNMQCMSYDEVVKELKNVD